MFGVLKPVSKDLAGCRWFVLHQATRAGLAGVLYQKGRTSPKYRMTL